MLVVAFHCLFHSGSRQAVISALKAYQNSDGGFGNALEPDKRCPDSQPVDVEMALRILDMIGILAIPELSDSVRRDMIQPACNFLASIASPEGGVPFALPSVSRYPHAPWWNVDDNPPASLNPTADIVGLMLKHGIQHPWLERASEFCWREIETSETESYHDLMPMICFLEHVADQPRAQVELERIARRIRRPGVVEMDALAGGYVLMPLDWAPSPNSFCRPLFDQTTIDLHLKALIERQQLDGGWTINWKPISKAVEIEWRGWKTIEALCVLKAYAVLE